MHHDQRRQPCGVHCLGKRQVGGNLQAVGGFVPDRLHGRQPFASQLFADFVLEREIASFAIEQVRLAGLGVPMRGDQPLRLVPRAGGNRDFLAGKLFFQPFEVRSESRVLEVAAIAIV